MICELLGRIRDDLSNTKKFAASASSSVYRLQLYPISVALSFRAGSVKPTGASHTDMALLVRVASEVTFSRATCIGQPILAILRDRRAKVAQLVRLKFLCWMSGSTVPGELDIRVADDCDGFVRDRAA